MLAEASVSPKNVMLAEASVSPKKHPGGCKGAGTLPAKSLGSAGVFEKGLRHDIVHNPCVK